MVCALVSGGYFDVKGVSFINGSTEICSQTSDLQKCLNKFVSDCGSSRPC